MGFTLSPLGIAAVVAAVCGPLLAGLVVVMWSKARSAAQAARAADLDARLKGLYRTVEMRTPPLELTGALDALEAREALQASVAAQAQTTSTRQARRGRGPPRG